MCLRFGREESWKRRRVSKCCTSQYLYLFLFWRRDVDESNQMRTRGEKDNRDCTVSLKISSLLFFSSLLHLCARSLRSRMTNLGRDALQNLRIRVLLETLRLNKNDIRSLSLTFCVSSLLTFLSLLPVVVYHDQCGAS